MPTKVLGPSVIVWDGRGVDGTPVEFHMTFGGVFFRYEELRAPIQRDQAGLTHVDEATTGVINPELEAPFTQELLTKLKLCYANSAAVAGSLRISNPVGEAVFVRSRQVIVKPITNGIVETDTEEWLYIHRAFPRVSMEQVYDNAGQRVTKVFFKGFPDDNSPWVNQLWQHGTIEADPS